MKFLIHSNAPNVKTGYGVQCAHLTRQLLRAGHEVAVSATYGCEATPTHWTCDAGKALVLPRGYEVISNDLITGHADYFFRGEPGWIITLLDVWAVTNPLLSEYNVAAWVPIDHFPVPPGVLRFFSMCNAVPVAMSEYGKRQLFEAGLDPLYIPLSVDTSVYRPTSEVGGVTGRTLIGVDDDAFVVGMVAMNKGWSKDRKGFNEAFWAFGQFLKTHPDAVLYLHTEKFGGAEGQNLDELRIHAGIPDTNIRWAEQYAYRSGYTPDMMAAVYTAMDVLLAPSHGEGFCVPLIEAQACGTPVIATDFSAQPELTGAGWLLQGQPEWDAAQHAAYVCPLIDDVLEKLHLAYDERGNDQLARGARDFAVTYDTETIFDRYWRPFLVELSDTGTKVDVEREPMLAQDAVAVLCPVLNRPQNVKPLVQSFLQHTNADEAVLYFVVDDDDLDEQKAIDLVRGDRIRVLPATHGSTFAEKLNAGYEQTAEPWLLVIGDDVQFHPGWLDAARELSADFDVIGTNDAPPGKKKNPKVAAGTHADHFFVRRAYVEEHGGCLDGPGVLAPECYAHWFTDMEIVKLARARGVFTPCFGSLVEHLHPGYDGDETARINDPTYVAALVSSEADKATWLERVPLIEQQRTSRARVA